MQNKPCCSSALEQTLTGLLRWSQSRQSLRMIGPILRTLASFHWRPVTFSVTWTRSSELGTRNRPSCFHRSCGFGSSSAALRIPAARRQRRLRGSAAARWKLRVRAQVRREAAPRRSGARSARRKHSPHSFQVSQAPDISRHAGPKFAGDAANNKQTNKQTKRERASRARRRSMLEVHLQ